MSSLTTITATATATVSADASHILVFPYPAQGHMLPLLDLTHQLALHGVKITILITPKNLPTLKPLLSTHPHSIQTFVLPLPTHPNLPSEVENVQDTGHSGIPAITEALTMLEGEVIQWFRTHPHPPQAIISDFFLGFTNHWAKWLDIPRIAFFTSGAFLVSVLVHLLQNVGYFRHFEVVELISLPRSPSFSEDHVPSIYKMVKEGDTVWHLLKDAIIENFRSWGIVFNTFHPLEGEYLKHIKKEVGHERVYGVGPLSSIGLNRAIPSLDVGHGVLNWLDKSQDESVLYVCFGSQKLLTKPQIEALALGLEQCEPRFVWVIKAENSHLVPDGFEDRVTNRGFLVHGWAPQVEILNHRAIGGFVSHCGWNSTLESIMAGVMVMTWPMEADQFVNAKLLVKYMESAVHLCEGGHAVPNPNEVARVIRESFGGNIPQKERAKLLKEKAFEAVKPGGSSLNDLDELVKQFSKIGVSKASQ